MTRIRIAVIGAGLAGLSCARELARTDADITVFERSRGLGGRLATRRSGELAFDHGAQFLTARGRPFVRYIETAVRSECAGAWRPRILEDQRRFDEPIDDWLVGTPGMSSIVRPLAHGLRIRTGVLVRELLRGRKGWELDTDAGRLPGAFDAVAVAIPAPGALTLLGPHGRAFRQLTSVGMAPCWTTMAAFAEPLAALAEQAYRYTNGSLAWAANDSSKPGRAAGPQTWVLHSSPRWAERQLEADAEQAARLLLKEFSEALGESLPVPVSLQAHRWRLALVEQPLGLPCLADEEIAAGACGDWCTAPRAEAAFDSGRALARSLLSAVGLSAAPARRH
ncbi:MAG TPA: FAD-dependent oxidoreductase [Steroidobacteraceae bacterium]|nr:FAD-dependent oxidoreductase [Steroidobacteraceae bacterium]